MQEHAMFPGYGANIGKWRNGADFAVDIHHRDERGMRGYGVPNIVRIDPAGAVDRHIGDFEPLLFKGLTGVQDGFVLGGGGDNMVALIAVGPGNAFEGEIIGFGGTTGKDDLFGFGIDECGHLFPRCLHGFLCLPAVAMRAAGSIAKFFGEIGHHSLEHSGSERCSGMMIEVNWSLHTAHPW